MQAIQVLAMSDTQERDKTKRTTIVLPAKVYELLEQRAAFEGRATANLAAYVVELYIRNCFPEEFPNPYQK